MKNITWCPSGKPHFWIPAFAGMTNQSLFGKAGFIPESVFGWTLPGRIPAGYAFPTPLFSIRGFRYRHLLCWLFLIGFAMIFAGGCGEKKPAPTALQPPDVDVVNVLQQDVPIYSEWIGTTQGLVNAVIRAQVTGYLSKRNYKEGSFVRKGDLLFEIDPRTFQAAMDQAQGQLAAAKARLGKTELDVKRYTPLAKQSAISQQELDDAIQANLAAKAGIQSAAATVEQAKLNLGFTRIASPIDGIAGAANAQMGDLVGPGQIGELTTVSTVNPIQVNFSISEQEYMGRPRPSPRDRKEVWKSWRTSLS